MWFSSSIKKSNSKRFAGTPRNILSTKLFSNKVQKSEKPFEDQKNTTPLVHTPSRTPFKTDSNGIRVNTPNTKLSLAVPTIMKENVCEVPESPPEPLTYVDRENDDIFDFRNKRIFSSLSEEQLQLIFEGYSELMPQPPTVPELDYPDVSIDYDDMPLPDYPDISFDYVDISSPDSGIQIYYSKDDADRTLPSINLSFEFSP